MSEVYSYSCYIIKKLITFSSLNSELGLPAPEMTFIKSLIKVYSNKFELIFNAKDALKLVNKRNNNLKVSYADHWSRSR